MTNHEFVICIDNNGYEASLKKRKLYKIIKYADADKHRQLRVIDESGEDYLYLSHMFQSCFIDSQCYRTCLLLTRLTRLLSYL